MKYSESVLLTIKFPNRNITSNYQVERPDCEPYIVAFHREVDGKRFELRIPLDPRKILGPTDLLECRSYQGSLSSSDIVVQEIECNQQPPTSLPE